MSEKHWYLKNCSLFQHLDERQLRTVEEHSRCRSFSAGSPISLPNENSDHVFLLTTGLIKISHLTPDAKETILTFVEPGELFGELAIFDGQPRDEFVKAVQASTILMIPTDQIHQLMAKRVDVALAITKLVGLRRQRIERRLKNLLFLSNRDRLIHLLLEFAEQYGFETDEGIRLRIKLSHQDLANLIGSTRETVTVTLGQLRAEGSVKCGRCKIVLTQPDALAHSVGRKPPQRSLPSAQVTPLFAAN